MSLALSRTNSKGCYQWVRSHNFSGLFSGRKVSIQMDWKKFVNRTVIIMLGSISADLLAGLKEFAIKFRADARVTTNPWDDMIADLICGILGIPDETEITGGSSPH